MILQEPVQESEGVDYYVVTSKSNSGVETKKRVYFSSQKQSSNEQLQKPQKEIGKNVSAEINPTSDKLLGAVSRAKFRKGKIITEVGCGNKISISLGRKDLWIGIDPSVKPETSTLDRGFNQVYSDSERFLCTDYVSGVPEMDADLVLLVAPNPADITDNDMLSGVLEKTMNGKAKLMLVLDTQSYESVLNPSTLELDDSGLEEVKRNVNEHFNLSDYEIEVIPWYEDGITSEEMKDLVGISNPISFNSNFLPQEKLLIVVQKKVTEVS